MSNILVREFKQGEELYVAEAHKRIYSQEYKWNTTFTDYAAKIPIEFASKQKTAREALWIAANDDVPVGSIMLCETEDPELGQLRLFLIEKEYRGCGLGSKLINTLLDKARNVGFKRLVLSTASPLASAIHLYKKVGFHITKEEENSSWTNDGSTLNEVFMEMTL